MSPVTAVRSPDPTRGLLAMFVSHTKIRSVAAAAETSDWLRGSCDFPTDQ